MIEIVIRVKAVGGEPVVPAEDCGTARQLFEADGLRPIADEQGRSYYRARDLACHYARGAKCTGWSERQAGALRFMGKCHARILDVFPEGGMTVGEAAGDGESVALMNSGGGCDRVYRFAPPDEAWSRVGRRIVRERPEDVVKLSASL